MNIIKRLLGKDTVLTRYEITSENLPPEFDGFKALHISDFHCAPQGDMLECIEGEAADAIFATGDMCDEKRDYTPCVELIAELSKRAPIYQISGNHDEYRADFSDFCQKCRKAGSIFLQNETAVIERENAKILVHGIGDPITKKEEEADRKVHEALGKLRRGSEYEILLFHRANKLDFFKDENFDLILAGHMHGGQIRLPIVGGVLSPKSGLTDTGRLLFPKYTGGLYKIGGSDAVVNRGMGNSAPFPRFGNPTEIVSITFHSEKV